MGKHRLLCSDSTDAEDVVLGADPQKTWRDAVGVIAEKDEAERENKTA